ncbi:MAG: PQQ-dependent sugar dehydrogenase [Saprospiraceae bacterium]|nr:PQQ-dependent sugar dehydrogenase [Saprospiraceae bacterium]
MKFPNRIISLFVFLVVSLSCNEAQVKTPPAKTSKTHGYVLEKVVDDVEIPWGMAFLPDGSILYTEKRGDLILFQDGSKTVIRDVPPAFAHGQGGLLDVILHPNYKDNGWIYLSQSYAEDGQAGNTRIIRGKLDGDRLADQQVLYQASPATNRAHHFGSRMKFDRDGYLYFSIGDRGERDVNPQDVKRDNGKIYRIHDDGRIPEDNPFVGTPGAKAAIYSYGHRNPQGMDRHPATGEIWTHEHGPRGGDEINIIRKGKNCGWPVISYGINYSGTKFTEITHKEGMEQPLHQWTPSIAPSGMAFVNSDYYPDWKGSLMVGALKFMYLQRVVLDGDKVVREEKLFEKSGRLRDVRQAPDGFLYISVEQEGIFKIVKG